MPNTVTDLTIKETVDLRYTELTADIAGQLMPSSARVYKIDMQAFLDWITEQGLSLAMVKRSDIIRYRLHLAENLAKRTAMRRFSVVRRLYQEALIQHLITEDPTEHVRGFKTSSDEETPHKALMLDEVRDLLSHINKSTLIGLRNYALLMLCIRTGLRRAEAAALNVDDLSTEQGHYILTIRHGKGDKRRIVKVPVDVYRDIQDYRRELVLADGFSRPLFLTHWKGGKVRGRITEKAIERMLLRYAQHMTPPQDLTPHDLRATFITLALEGGAKLENVQHAAGHADPRTTLHYQKRKLSLDDNPVDYIRGL